MSLPDHSEEHRELIQLLAKATEQSTLISNVILITIGMDGRPCVGSDITDVPSVLGLLRYLSDAGRYVEGSAQIPIPRSN